MRQTETCSICYLLTRFDRQVRTNCPIRSKKQCHNDQHSDSICQKRRTGKHNQPVSSRCLLYLYITCSKKCTHLCVLCKAYQKNVDNKCNKQKNHSISKAFSKYLFYTYCYCILSKIWINHHRIHIKSVFESYQHRPEVICQSTGTNCQDQISYNCFECTAKSIIPRFSQKYITYHNDQTNHKRRLLKNICRKIRPYSH